MHCNGCDLDKNVNEFSWKNKSKGKRQSRCKKCSAATQAAWYAGPAGERHRQAVYRYQKTQVQRKRQYIAELKGSTACADCGNLYPSYVMDFDHLGDKVCEVARMVYLDRITFKRMLAEIAKCEIVCANCHRIRTWSGEGSGDRTHSCSG